MVWYSHQRCLTFPFSVVAQNLCLGVGHHNILPQRKAACFCSSGLFIAAFIYTCQSDNRIITIFVDTITRAQPAHTRWQRASGTNPRANPMCALQVGTWRFAQNPFEASIGKDSHGGQTEKDYCFDRLDHTKVEQERPF